MRRTDTGEAWTGEETQDGPPKWSRRRLRRCCRRIASCRCLQEESYEIKDLNLCEQAEHDFPGRRWGELDLKDQVEVVRNSLRPDGILIDPHCTYMKYWDLLIVTCLIFMGVVTPFEVIFVGPLDFHNWLFFVNRFVDLVFLKDMVMQFFLKVEKTGGRIIRDPWVIRKMYLKTWFPVDLIGVMQFDLFLMALDSKGTLQGIKFLRMVRLLRLMKLVRMLRGSRALNRWQNYVTVSFAAQKLIKFSFGTLLWSHWMACFWGLVGFSLGRELCLNGQRMELPEQLPRDEVSWVTSLYVDGKYSPDDPCNPWHVYAAALYWSVMTITSIGYGDIVPIRTEEYIAAVFCMLAGGVLWANIIGGICAVIARGDPVQDHFEQNTDLLNTMMEESGILKKHQYIYREFLREAKVYESHLHFRTLADNFSPQLKGKLLLQINRAWTRHLPYLRKLHHHTRCLMVLIDALEHQFFARKEVLHISSDRLCICERGTVALGGKVVIPGGVFHVDFIVANPSLRRREETVALTYSLIMNIRRESFLGVIAGAPEVEKAVARAALVYAMSRCIHLCAEEYKKMRRRGGLEPMSFADVFDRVVIEGKFAEKTSRGSEPQQVVKVNFLGMETDMCPSRSYIGLDKTDDFDAPTNTMATVAMPPINGPLGRRFCAKHIVDATSVDNTSSKGLAALAQGQNRLGQDRFYSPPPGSVPMTRDEYLRLESAGAALRNALAAIDDLRSKAVIEIDLGSANSARSDGSAEDTCGDRLQSIDGGLAEVAPREVPGETQNPANCCRTQV